ncbi:hypothetical protein [Siphonobacter sp. BAB-5405]|uniref:hypothetical protein n=1 Tax=Siphonobacter sp. BAB-5405 TaxID=1864825 RepID=UPI0018EA4302|nr:hypothetical protein [Siphonobacter sp. BAB-5405]
MSKQIKYLFIGAILVLMAYMVYNATSQPGVQDLKGNFKEVALYRNENNTGPIKRMYAVTVDDTLWSEMKQYGDFMPHTKYGTTTVYFFKTGSAVPAELQPGEKPFDNTFQPLAKYEKDGMGEVSFQNLLEK